MYGILWFQLVGFWTLISIGLRLTIAKLYCKRIKLNVQALEPGQTMMWHSGFGHMGDVPTTDLCAQRDNKFELLDYEVNESGTCFSFYCFTYSTLRDSDCKLGLVPTLPKMLLHSRQFDRRFACVMLAWRRHKQNTELQRWRAATEIWAHFQSSAPNDADSSDTYQT